MNDGSESNTHLDVSNHIILVLDILGYSDLILNSDETRMLQQFDSMVTSIRENIAKMSGVNSRIQWKMCSDNFLIYAPLPKDADFLHLTVKGVLMTGATLQYKLITEHGYLSRGGCCFGNLYVDESYVFGSGLVKAHDLENGHRQPTTSVATDVAECVMSRKSGIHDPLESMTLVRRTEDECFIDYLRFIIHIATRSVNEGNYFLRIDDTVHYHKATFEERILPSLKKSIEKNRDDAKTERV